MALREEVWDVQKNQEDTNDATLKGLVGYLISTNRRLILRTKNIGAFLNVQGTTVTVTVILAAEFCDFLCARYNVILLQPPDQL